LKAHAQQQARKNRLQFHHSLVPLFARSLWSSWKKRLIAGISSFYFWLSFTSVKKLTLSKFFYGIGTRLKRQVNILKGTAALQAGICFKSIE
jgi:hypothetical protein